MNIRSIIQQGRFGAALAAAAAVLVVTLVVPATSVSAATIDSTPTSQSSVTVIQGTMTPECNNLSASTAAYIQDHGIQVCGYNQSATQGGIHPDGYATGNCGSSYVFIYDNNGGTADVAYGFNSTIGNMVYRNLVITWSGDEASGSFPDAAFMNNFTYNSPLRLIIPGYGPAGAHLGGSATTFYGLTCSMVGAIANTTL